MLKITTESGSVYKAHFSSKGLIVSKDNFKTQRMAIAIFPNRLPMLEDTVRVEREGLFHCGYNAAGRRTLRLIPEQVKPGMILANRRGMRSTRIAKVVAL